MTSGGAALQAAAALREEGMVVEDLFCVVDREEGWRRSRAGIRTGIATSLHLLQSWVSCLQVSGEFICGP